MTAMESGMTWQARIESNPNVCHGKVCIRGTRVMVSVLLDNIAAGIPETEILKSCPTVTTEDIRVLSAGLRNTSAGYFFAARIRRTEVRPIRSRRAMAALLMPARKSRRISFAFNAAVGGRPRRVPISRA